MIGPRPLYRAAALVIAMMAASAALASSAMTRSEACAIIDNRGVNPLSGIWRIGGDGATVAILPVAASSTRFDIYLIDSPDMSVIPGNKIGSAVSTGETGTFDAEMISGQGFTEKRMRYIMTRFTADGSGNVWAARQGLRWRASKSSFPVRISGK